MNTPSPGKFKPMKFGSKLVPDIDSNSNSSSSASSNHKNNIVEKGSNDTLKIDINELDKLISNLRKNADTHIRELSGELGEQFRQLVSYVSLLYDSSSYVILYNVVHKYFANIENIIPGTIGAYCAGCHVNTSFTEYPGCSPICSGSMPPKNDEWEFCKNTVILGTYENNRFSFALLKSGENKSDKSLAYIFVNYSNHNTFPGFTEGEKKQLKSLGIEYVHLNGYKENGKEYLELIEGATNVDNIKSRVSVVETKIPQKRGLQDIGLILLIAILILVVLFLAWRYWQVNF